MYVTNYGPGTVTNVVVTNTLPSGFSLISASPTYTLTGNTLTFNLGSLTNLAVQKLLVSAKPASAGSYTFSASVNSTNNTDLNTANNSASFSVNVGNYLSGSLSASLVSTQLVDLQSGLEAQFIQIVNNGSASVSSARVVVTGLTNQLWGAGRHKQWKSIRDLWFHARTGAEREFAAGIFAGKLLHLFQFAVAGIRNNTGHPVTTRKFGRAHSSPFRSTGIFQCSGSRRGGGFFGQALPISLTLFFTATILNLPIRCFPRKSCRQQGQVLTNRNGLTTARLRPSAFRPIQRLDIIAYFPIHRIECERRKLGMTAWQNKFPDDVVSAGTFSLFLLRLSPPCE